MSALVLVENEVTYGGQYDHWQDLTGVSYQFPNQYRQKIIPGRRFVYYRGVRRMNNQRGPAEYFGVGHIASVWRDLSLPESVPRAKWRWYCAIEDYLPFPKPVPSKVNGEYLEPITHALGWRTAVRELTDGVFESILTLAGMLDIAPELLQERASLSFPLPASPIDEMTPTEHPDGLNALIQPSHPAQPPSSANLTDSYRRTTWSKQIGDHAEAVVLKWLQAKLAPAVASSLTWVAQQGQTPGWDIEFIDGHGTTIAVEVKGTTGAIFHSVDITAQEWEAAQKRRETYWLVLVADCLGMQPKVHLIQDPYACVASGDLALEPVLWRLRRKTPHPSPDQS
jgi:hypothetical protein